MSQAADSIADPAENAGLTNPRVAKEARALGHQMLTYATDLVDRERMKLKATMRSFKTASIFLLILVFVIMVWTAMELSRQILQPLGRAVEYTGRIASGDFTLITPKRKYRDEFSNLAVAINRMIYELMEKHEQLVQSRKMAAVGTLTSGIAHELNNPLNNIGLTTEALLDDMDAYNDAQKEKMLQDIFKQVERASVTVKNLLDFTRVETNKPELIDIKELIRGTLELSSNQIKINNIEVSTDIGDDLKKVMGNFRDLQQVFLNIIINGVQAMDGGGSISIEAANHDDKYIKVVISDTGCGIDKENIDHIFDPFFTTKEVGEGTGLGLSLSYGILQKMGGNITVKSEPGKGTSFSVYLPMAKSPV